jgi:hypothetical protein
MNPRISKLKAFSMFLLMVIAAPLTFANSDCKTLVAVQNDRLITAGCTSPIGFCAGGSFRGNHGFSGDFFFSAINMDPIVSDTLGRLVVPGVSTYTTNEGRLIISDVSVFDTVRGTFAGVGRITDGTGRFAGATGEIFTTGRVSSDGQSFTTLMTGDVCFAN